ncbi:helix-turn-helix domain-containing protein [Kitasatospora sp. NPDC059088]|uniref:AraC family transcriptional regulator n=1 Tax=Kitasatospora sp. NPDC059088 TaxID=3346722 RepID=UPI0036C76FE2
MVESGHVPGIRQVRYSPEAGSAGFGVEVLSFERLRRMDRARRRERPQRPDFHVLALVRSGRGRQVADFVDHPLGERSVVWIRPGVVHRWAEVDGVDGPLVLFEPEVLAGAVGVAEAAGVAGAAGVARAAGVAAFGASCWQVDQEDWGLVLAGVEHLAREHAAAVAREEPFSRALLGHLLAALLLRAGPPEALRPSAAAGDREVFRRYRAAVEEGFARRHHVADYARELGCTVRTLTRASRAASGLGAKRFLDERILLEAERLLAHTDLPLARCAERVGFDDAANFAAFFRRLAGESPGRWREAAAGR